MRTMTMQPQYVPNISFPMNCVRPDHYYAYYHVYYYYYYYDNVNVNVTSSLPFELGQVRTTTTGL